MRPPASEAQVLIVHSDAALRRDTERALQRHGLRCASLQHASELRRLAHARPPQLMLVELAAGAAETLRAVKQWPSWEAVELILIGAAPVEIELLAQLGARDYSTRPDDVDDWVTRARQCLLHRQRPAFGPRHEQELTALVEIIEDLSEWRDIREALFRSSCRLQRLMQATRVSIVLAQAPHGRAFVVTSSDRAALTDLTIELDDYPELSHCLTQRSALLIDDAQHSPLLAAHSQLDAVPFRSMALAPIGDESRAFGVLYLRAARARAFHPYVLPLLKAIGRAAAIAIRQAELMQELRTETQQNTEARRQAEQRLRSLQPYAEFFNTSADPMLVIDGGGRIAFANPLARRLAGNEHELEGAHIADFLAPQERPRARELAQGFARGSYPKGEDFRVITPTGERVVNVNFSETLRDQGAILLTLRDVTQQRETERELRQTTEFLERVIESSVDAIVSADATGRILVFNRAAARVFGYPPSHVLNRVNVEQLYPPGVARDVMRKIRSADYGGPDVLTDYQVNLVDSEGRHIPVKISAGLIYENGRPAGSVGVFTDIREKLRMRANLRAAQEELRQHERSVAVAQLAGATAHELNQPLTAVLGYAELLARRLGEEPTLRQAAEVIAGEAERMANIVKRIGRLTRYETMTYVGGSQILDLEKASPSGLAHEVANEPSIE